MSGQPKKPFWSHTDIFHKIGHCGYNTQFFFNFLAHNQSDMVNIYYRNLKPKGFNINLGISKLSHTDIVNTVIISPNLLKD